MSDARDKHETIRAMLDEMDTHITRLIRERDDALRMCKQEWENATVFKRGWADDTYRRAFKSHAEVETYLRDPGALDEEPES